MDFKDRVLLCLISWCCFSGCLVLSWLPDCGMSGGRRAESVPQRPIGSSLEKTPLFIEGRCATNLLESEAVFVADTRRDVHDVGEMGS